MKGWQRYALTGILTFIVTFALSYVSPFFRHLMFPVMIAFMIDQFFQKDWYGPVRFLYTMFYFFIIGLSLATLKILMAVSI